MTTPIAAFDFDGTLARGDSLIPYLTRLLGGRRVARSVLRHAHSFGLVQLGRAQRDLVKERFIAHTLTGRSAEEIATVGEDFAEQLIATRLLPSMHQRVEWHRAQGHRLVLVSASLDVYLGPLVRNLGFDDLLCTQLEILNGRASGKLVGVNVRADEKALQLSKLIGDRTTDTRAVSAGDVDSKAELWAYGNSSGDVAMLSMADHPFWVDRRGNFSPWVPR